MLCECFAHKDGEHKSSFGPDLDWVRIVDLAPGYSLIGSCAGIGSVHLDCSIDVDRDIRSATSDLRIGDVMLDHTATQDEDASLLCLESDLIDLHNVLHDINNEALLYFVDVVD